MSKTKQIMSMILVAVMVMTSFPVGSSLTATAAGSDVTWNTPAGAPTGVSCVVSGAEVIRVAFNLNSYLNGTKIVPANANGLPVVDYDATSRPYVELAYAGVAHNKAQCTPKITLNFSQRIETTPTITVSSMNGKSCNVSFINISNTNNNKTFTYDFNINAGLTAEAGDTLLYTINYVIDEVTYTTYHTSDVREISSPVGKSWYGVRHRGGTYGSRLSELFAIQGAGLYGRIGYKPENDGWGANGKVSTAYSAAQSKSTERVLVNWACKNLTRSTSADETNSLIEGNVANATWPSVYSNAELKEIRMTDDEFDKNGWDDDENRSRGDLYIDRSVVHSANDINLKYTLTQIDQGGEGRYGGSSLCSYIAKIDQQCKSGFDTDSWDDNDHSAEASHFRMYTRWDDGATVYGQTIDTIVEAETKGSQAIVPLSGDLFTNDTSYISAESDLTRGHPKRVSMMAAMHSYSAFRASSFVWNYEARPVGVWFGLDIYIYVTDKSDLRNVLNVINGSSASCTLTSDSYISRNAYSSGTFTRTKGILPQANAYTESSYNTYRNAYIAAVQALNDGKSYNQVIIANATANLINAYNGLQSVSDTVKAYLYLDGTTTPVPGTNASGYTSQTYLAGDTAVATAPATIGGYSRISPETQSAAVTANTADIIFYYKATEFTYKFDPVEVDAGGNNGDGVTGVKEKKFTFAQTYNLANYAPEFTYNGYTIEGWYQNYNRTSGVFSNRLADSYTVSEVGDKTLYAKWELAPVLLHYNIAMTGQTMADAVYHPGDQLVKPADPDFDGFTFGGWYTDASFATPFNWNATVEQPYVNNAANPNYVSEITAYAKFTTFNGKVVFEENGGDAVTDIDLTGYADNASVTLPTPTRLGYTFDGWYAKSDLSGSKVTTVTATPTMKVTGIGLYAKWVPKTFTINFDIKYDEYTASPIDTTTNPAPITGAVGENIVNYCASTSQTLPGTITRYGWDFMGWTKNANVRNREFTTRTAYDQAVSNGYRYDLEEADAVFQATDDAAITLYPMWVKNTNNAIINLDTYKMMSGEAVPTDETDISNGDIVTVRMSATTNFFTGSSTFVYMYDNTFFELVNDGTSAFTLNGDNDYIKAINGTADYFGYTDSDSSFVPAGVTYPANDTTASHYNWIQVSIDPDTQNGYVKPGASAGGSYILEFKLRVIATDAATPDKGVVFMDNAWTRTKENNGGTMFFGCCATASVDVWDSYNNIVLPDLTYATSTVTLKPDNSTETAVTLNPNGGTWPDNTTGTKYYSGDAEEEILDYVGTPSKFGYTFINFTKDGDDSDVWAEGYYATVENNGATYIAQWKGDDVTNTFMNNDGTDAFTTVVSEYGSDIVTPADPTRTGYDFAGWAATADAQTGSDDLGTQSTVEGATYYAVWTPKTDTPFKFTITYINNTNGNTANVTAPGTNKTTYEAMDGTTVNAFGTTGATIHIVPDADHQEDTATDVYIKYSELPKVATGNYIFDVENAGNVLEGEIYADGSAVLTLFYVGRLTTTTFDANGGVFDVPTPAKQVDTSKEGTYGTGNGVGFNYESNALAKFFVEYGKSISNLGVDEPEREGYTFGGWGASATATNPVNLTNANATKDNYYYAIWNGITVTNTFDANGGAFESGTTATKDSVFGKAIAKPATNPTRDGYTFLGWAATNTATEAADLGDQSSVTGTTFYAVWKLNDQTYNIDVYYMDNTGAYGEKDVASTTGTGSGVITVDPATYAKDGFTFDSANSATSITLDTTTVGTTQTIVVKYKRDQYTITYKVDGVQDGEPVSVYWGAAIQVKQNPTKTGYTFSGWKKDGTEPPVAMPKENIELNGTFTINSYELTVNYFYPDGVTPIAPAHTEDVNYNATYTVASPAVIGYTPGTATVTGTMPAEDKTVDVVYTINSYPITIHYIYSDGTTAKPDYTGNVAYNDSYNVASPVITGYTADKTAISGVMGTSAVTETVTYTVNTHSLTINYVFADGTSAAPQHKENVNYGVAYSVDSPAVTGYTANTLKVEGTMADEDVTVTVTYTVNKYVLTVKYQYADGTKAADDYTAEVQYNTTYNVASSAITGYTPDIATVTGVMPAEAKTVTVTYKVNSYLLTVKYQYADGSEAAPDATRNVNYNASYSVDSPAITGYTADILKAEGTMPAAAKTVTVTYTVNTYTLTIHFVDGDGAKVADDATYTVAYNTDYSYSVASVTGYTPAKNAVTGKMPADNKAETVVYTLNNYSLMFVAPKLLANGTLSTVSADDANSYTLISSSIVAYKSAVSAPEARVIENYTFNSWSPAVPGTMPAQDTFIVATYDRVEVSIDLIEASVAVIDDEVDETNTINGYIYGVDSCVTVTAFEEAYVKAVGNGHLEVTPAYNYRKFNTVGTGTKVELIDDVTAEVVETYYVVVYGDLNGDGFCDSIDVAMMREEIAVVDSTSILDGTTKGTWTADALKTAAPQMKAADLDGNGVLDSNDLTLIKDIAGFRAEVDQATRAITYYGA